MTLDTLRKAARPAMMVALVILIGPLAIATGLLESVFPGVGVRFAKGFADYMHALPDAFWAFAAGAFGIYSVSRSFGNDKRLEATELLAEVSKREKEGAE